MKLLKQIQQARALKSLGSRNAYDQQYKTARLKSYYEEAAAYMAGKSYLERRLSWFKFSLNFRRLYHPISVILSLTTAGLLTTRYLSWTDLNSLMIVVLLFTFICLVIIFVALEWGKKEKASDVFLKMAEGEKIPYLQWVSLLLLVSASLLVSALGGALIGETQTNKSKHLEQKKDTAIHRIDLKYQKRLAQLSRMIARLEHLSTDSRLRRWGLTKEEQTNLVSGKAERDTLLRQRTQEISFIDRDYIRATEANDSARLLGMGIGFGLVFLMELLMVYAYYFQGVFMKRVEIEGVQHEILPTPTAAPVTTGEPTTLLIAEAIAQSFGKIVAESSHSGGEGTPPPPSSTRNEISLRPGKHKKNDQRNHTSGTTGSPGTPLTKNEGSTLGSSGSPPLTGSQKKAGISATTGTPPMTATSIKKKLGYYIPSECFDRYYAGRDKVEEPFRKLRWYEAVLPDLQAGVKYQEILGREYEVYQAQQGRYVVKRIGDTTLRRTIVGGLKSLMDT